MAGSNTPNPIGRPTKMTEATIAALRQAYLVGANDREAYGYANISHETFYNYIQKHPEFREQIIDWQNEPILKAKTMAVRGIDKDIKAAHWYLERRAKKDYGANVDLTTDGEKLEGLVIVRDKDADSTK